MSGAGTVLQATRRGGRKALALGVAHYFPWYCLWFPASRHRRSQRGCLQEGPRGHFRFCGFARSLITVRPHCHPRHTAGCWGAAEGGSGPHCKHAPVSRPCLKDLAGGRRCPSGAVGTAGSCASWVTPLPAAFLSLQLNQAIGPALTRPLGSCQLLGPCQPARGFACSWAGAAASRESEQSAHEENCSLVYLSHKTQSPQSGSLSIISLLLKEENRFHKCVSVPHTRQIVWLNDLRV